MASLSLAACDPGEEAETDAGDTEAAAEDSAATGADDDGGDDGDDGVPANTYCDPVSTWDSNLVEFEEDVLVLVNEARAAGATCGSQSFGAASPLAMNSALRCAARVHSKDMGDRAYFDHNNPDGEDPFVRMERAGYSFSTAGENIAAGQTSPQMVMQGWMESPGHCSNIMNPAFTEFGVGAYDASGAPFPIYWTQTFGAP